jgi:hypothetical protein
MGLVQKLRRIDDRLLTVGLVVVYLAIMATLAFVVDMRFLFNDIVAIVVWVGIGIALFSQGFLRTRR